MHTNAKDIKNLNYKSNLLMRTRTKNPMFRNAKHQNHAIKRVKAVKSLTSSTNYRREEKFTHARPSFIFGLQPFKWHIDIKK